MFFENFSRICVQKGTSPTSVCKALKISTSGVTSWKHGSSPRSDILARIADYLGVTVSDLLDDPSPTDRILHLPITDRTVSDEEYEIIVAMRRQPEMIPPIRRLLALPDSDVKKAES